ncbi:hypothetical protein [Jannaschia seohaensis]|uniref:hypothetical protein n=1 Tax=Jannaschia seohaensis TaxID=475081 RepID=UPI00387E29B9
MPRTCADCSTTPTTAPSRHLDPSDGGGNGADILVGGRGTDMLTGGNGPDVFVYKAAQDAPGHGECEGGHRSLRRHRRQYGR